MTVHIIGEIAIAEKDVEQYRFKMRITKDPKDRAEAKREFRKAKNTEVKGMDPLVRELINDPDAFETWRFYGTARDFKSWCAYIVLEYRKRRIDVYA